MGGSDKKSDGKKTNVPTVSIGLESLITNKNINKTPAAPLVKKPQNETKKEPPSISSKFDPLQFLFDSKKKK